MVDLTCRPGSTDMARTSYVQRIVDDVRARVESGQLKPGEKLPTYAEMAEQYGCSDGPVFQAIRILEALGYIEGHQGKGVYVSDRGGGDAGNT